MIIMENISKVYGSGRNRTEALSNISLYVEKGSFCSVVGASGSGKSTLLNIAGCLDAPTEGMYFLDDEEIKWNDKSRLADIRGRKIGFVFQSFNLIKNLTAIENVEMPMVLAGVSPKKRREAAERALEIVGLSERMYHRPYEMSGGQQQRTAVARAVVRNPELILADEPTGNLDEPSGLEVMKLLKKLNEMGSTVLMITHDMKKAKMTDKIIKIKDGRVEK